MTLCLLLVGDTLTFGQGSKQGFIFCSFHVRTLLLRQTIEDGMKVSTINAYLQLGIYLFVMLQLGQDTSRILRDHLCMCCLKYMEIVRNGKFFV